MLPILVTNLIVHSLKTRFKKCIWAQELLFAIFLKIYDIGGLKSVSIPTMKHVFKFYHGWFLRWRILEIRLAGRKSQCVITFRKYLKFITEFESSIVIVIVWRSLFESHRSQDIVTKAFSVQSLLKLAWRNVMRSLSETVRRIYVLTWDRLGRSYIFRFITGSFCFFLW